MDSVLRIVTQLQSEGKEVKDATNVIASLKSKIVEIEDVPHLPSGTKWKEQLDSQKEKVSKTLKYLKLNTQVEDFANSKMAPDELEAVTGSEDPIQTL